MKRNCVLDGHFRRCFVCHFEDAEERQNVLNTSAPVPKAMPLRSSGGGCSSGGCKTTGGGCGSHAHLRSAVFSISEAGMIIGFKQGKCCVIRHVQCFTAPAAAAIPSNSARVCVDSSTHQPPDFRGDGRPMKCQGSIKCWATDAIWARLCRNLSLYDDQSIAESVIQPNRENKILTALNCLECE